MNTKDYRRIAVWPDGMWADMDEPSFESYLTWKSDDFIERHIPEDILDDDVDEYIDSSS